MLNTIEDQRVVPFLRWPGGKRWLTPSIKNVVSDFLKDSGGIYHEPFLGGGAMFFELKPPKAVLSDLNEALIETFKTVRSSPQVVLENLKKLPVSEEKYYEIRSWAPQDPIDHAVRFIYLNRTCYGGLYRTNKNNEFNVPYGGGSRTPSILWERNILSLASDTLNQPGIKIFSSDYIHKLRNVEMGDVLYCDPVYINNTTKTFDRYNGKAFSWKDQVNLSEICNEAFHKGALVIISNAFNKEIKKLYPYALSFKLNQKKAIGNPSKDSKNGMEYLFILDPRRDKKIWQFLDKN